MFRQSLSSVLFNLSLFTAGVYASRLGWWFMFQLLLLDCVSRSLTPAISFSVAVTLPRIVPGLPSRPLGASPIPACNTLAVALASASAFAAGGTLVVITVIKLVSAAAWIGARAI
jgi:hypothetical protein